MTEIKALQIVEDSARAALSKCLNEPELPPAADVARALGYSPDDYLSVEWRGDDLVLTERGIARDVTFTIGAGLVGPVGDADEGGTSR